jgi:hypothetical protein
MKTANNVLEYLPVLKNTTVKLIIIIIIIIIIITGHEYNS